MELIALVAGGLVVGALARLALPGPDPMPLWATALLGMAGGLLGGAIGLQVAGMQGGLLFSVVAATLLLLAYRLVVQKRPITGPGARRGPGRPAAGTTDADDPAARLERLRGLRDAGVITEEEYELRRRAVAEPR
ncbi:MAG: SHOCT domain-containing protein [Thermoleophilia bacterium]|nr:SHOCT domain-containing protein [Thermoleophilia bacterium]